MANGIFFTKAPNLLSPSLELQAVISLSSKKKKFHVTGPFLRGSKQFLRKKAKSSTFPLLK